MNSASNKTTANNSASQSTLQGGTFSLSPRDFCQLSPRLLAAVRDPVGAASAIRAAILFTVVGTALYGFSFGVWRAPTQGLISALKLPILFFSITAASALLNTMFAQLMGFRISFRQVCALILTGMTITAIILGAWSPIACYWSLQTPPPEPAITVGLQRTDPAAARAMRVYERLLLAHTSAVGIAGVLGNIRLHRILTTLTGNPRHALRLLLVWLAVMGFVGFQLSWMLSPFLGDPVSPLHVRPLLYGRYNVYEYIWHCLQSDWR